jgi:hypothetical protein
MDTFQPITVTASLTLARDVHQGNTVNINALAGLTVTLPASTGKGDKYKIFVPTTVTSNSYIVQVANATDIMQGAVGLTTDIAGSVMPCAATTDTITMNGSTTGGVKGSYVELEDVSVGIWKLSGNLICTGTEATPFSAAVS